MAEIVATTHTTIALYIKSTLNNNKVKRNNIDEYN